MLREIAALNFDDEVTDRAREIGSANTLVRIDDSCWCADYTDAQGAVVVLKELLEETVPRDAVLPCRATRPCPTP